jgi:Heterokaryon incompatibility protein (HET)
VLGILLGNMSTGLISSIKNAYVYDNLNSSNKEIRLLLLKPSKSSKAQIECSLVNVSLNDNPTFEALSYAWGNPTIVESILLDGQIFHVTSNALSALKGLRYKKQSRTLWIDAISINQDSLEEREAQLQLMGTIYRKSSSVRVWLGPDGEGDKDAIAILKEMTSTKGVKATLKYGKSQKREGRVRQFFARAWWERLWVVQEVALGQHVVFQQGSKELEYKELLAAYKTTNNYFSEHLKGFSNGVYHHSRDDFMEIFESVNVLNQIRELCGADFPADNHTRVREATMTWTVAANLLRNKKASVDKDRLYALYGLLPPGVAQNSGMEPSYSISTEKVFTDLAYSIMESSQSFMMFSFLNQRPFVDLTGLPSWAPDWRLAPVSKYEANLRVVREQLFNASKDTPFHLQRLSSNTICLKGFFVDIINVSQPAMLFPNGSPMLESAYKLWRKVWADANPSHAMPVKYLDGISAENAFIRTVLWGCELGPKEGTLQRLTEAESMAIFESHNFALNMVFSDGRGIAGETLSAIDARRTNYMMNCAKDRAFFVTIHQLIGMTQKNVQAGDHIFILAGNSHPIILRPSEKYADTWHAVGECYVQNLMDGEGVSNMTRCAEVEKLLYSRPEVQKIKGIERNPRWDEITEQPDGLWKWLLVE